MIPEIIYVIVSCCMGWGTVIAYVLTMPKEPKYKSPFGTLPKGYVKPSLTEVAEQ